LSSLSAPRKSPVRVLLYPVTSIMDIPTAIAIALNIIANLVVLDIAILTIDIP
jgi:hypothetical protein